MIVSYTKTFWVWKIKFRYVSIQQVINSVSLCFIFKNFLFWKHYRFIGNCKGSTETLCPPSNHLESLTSTVTLLSSSIILSFSECYVNEFIQYVTLSDRIFLLSIFNIQVVACISGSFLFIAEQHSMLWMYYSLFNHSLIEGHFGCFQFLALTNKGTVNNCVHVHVHVFIWMYVFISLG